MSGHLFDTNILIDALNGIAPAHAELEGASSSWISRISWIEVMVGAPERAAAATEQFLSRFRVVELDEAVARRATTIRRDHPRLKLPDAIILASAQAGGHVLVTRNVRDFPETLPGVRMPYRL